MRFLASAMTALSLCGCTQLPQADVPAAPPSQGQVVVTDVDGTLTPRNIDVFESRPSAAVALRALSKKGYKIVYITTRVPLFQSGLPGWLDQNGFPAGSLHVGQTADDRDHPETFKARVLTTYLQAGWRLAYAYGDSSTDFAAYASVGIPRGHVFALKRRGDDVCQEGNYQACLDGWTEHMPYVDREIPSIK